MVSMRVLHSLEEQRDIKTIGSRREHNLRT